MITGVAQRPKRGEPVCGDSYMILELGSRWLVMLADGTGHGAAAAAASQLAADYVSAHAHEELRSIMRGCGEALRGSRGAAMALLRLDLEARLISFISVGNVEMRGDCRARMSPIAFPGVLGRPVRKFTAFTYPLAAGDRVVLFTDGISRRFDLSALRHLPVQAAAEHLLATHGHHHDDATCVVVDFPAGEALRPETPRPAELDVERVIVEIEVALLADVVRCGSRAKQLAAEVGLDGREQQEVAIVASELASNMIKFAGAGMLRLRGLEPDRAGIELCAEDRGPGIADVEAALRDGYTQGKDRLAIPLEQALRDRPSLGTGLGAVKRLSDEITFETRQGGGQRVVCRKFPKRGSGQRR